MAQQVRITARDEEFETRVDGRGFTIEVDGNKVGLVDPTKAIWPSDGNPRDLAQVTACLRSIAKAERTTFRGRVTWAVADMLEGVEPQRPRPDEPYTLGAVVRDVDGLQWLRVSTSPLVRAWGPVGRISNSDTWKTYSNIDVVEVERP